jgi:hypothetical protein
LKVEDSIFTSFEQHVPCINNFGVEKKKKKNWGKFDKVFAKFKNHFDGQI